MPPAMSTNPINDILMGGDFDTEMYPDAIGENDAVIIINPTKYTLEYDDWATTTDIVGDKSAFDPDVIVDEQEEAEEKE